MTPVSARAKISIPISTSSKPPSTYAATRWLDNPDEGGRFSAPSSMITKRNKTMIAPAYTVICDRQ